MVSQAKSGVAEGSDKMFHVKQNPVKHVSRQNVSRETFLELVFEENSVFHVKQNPVKHVSQKNCLVKHFCETFCQT